MVPETIREKKGVGPGSDSNEHIDQWSAKIGNLTVEMSAFKSRSCRVR